MTGKSHGSKIRNFVYLYPFKLNKIIYQIDSLMTELLSLCWSALYFVSERKHHEGTWTYTEWELRDLISGCCSNLLTHYSKIKSHFASSLVQFVAFILVQSQIWCHQILWLLEKCFFFMRPDFFLNNIFLNIVYCITAIEYHPEIWSRTFGTPCMSETFNLRNPRFIQRSTMIWIVRFKHRGLK